MTIKSFSYGIETIDKGQFSRIGYFNVMLSLGKRLDLLVGIDVGKLVDR